VDDMIALLGKVLYTFVFFSVGRPGKEINQMLSVTEDQSSHRSAIDVIETTTD